MQLTQLHLDRYRSYLFREEKSPATLEKYLRDVRAFYAFAKGREITKDLTVAYKKYLTELRMEEAKRLLKETPLRIIDISQATGYNDVSYFIKVFQKHTGLTPAKYRDMQK